MKEIVGNLWEPRFAAPPFWRGITTNGAVKANGDCVMGRGVAKQAMLLFPNLARELGDRIHRAGNRPATFVLYRIFSFPVKHHWSEPADPKLIEESAEELALLADLWKDQTFILPRPGCGNGGLHWEMVQPLLLDLPDNVWIIDLPKLPAAVGAQ